MGEGKGIFDLEERTGKFGEDIIEFAKTLPETIINKPLISQLVRSGTSLGQIIWKLMEQNLKRILYIKFLFAKRRQKKQCIG